MQFTILPLLAALQHYTPNDDTWKNGMEVTYNMTYNSRGTFPDSAIIAEGTFPKSVTSNFTAKVKCQLEPNKPEHMQCQIADSEIVENIHLMNETISKTLNITSFPMIVELYEEHFKFDIKFDKSGIAELMMDSEMDTFYDDIRVIAYPFHAGVDMDTVTQGVYDAIDRFWTGNCDTNYKVLMLFEVIGVPDPVKKGEWECGQSIIIDKKRNMDKCQSRVTGFVPPNMKLWAVVDPEATIEIKSSESHIVAGDTQFISSTKFDGIVYPIKSDLTKMIDVVEEIKFEYVSVAPVTKKLETIKNPKSIGLLFGNK